MTVCKPTPENNNQEERALDLAEIEEEQAERKSIKKLWKQIQDPAAKKILKRIIKDYYGD